MTLEMLQSILVRFLVLTGLNDNRYFVNRLKTDVLHNNGRGPYANHSLSLRVEVNLIVPVGYKPPIYKVSGGAALSLLNKYNWPTHSLAFLWPVIYQHQKVRSTNAGPRPRLVSESDG